MKVRYRFFERPDEVKRLKKAVKKVKFLTPPWCDLLVFDRYDRVDGDPYAEVKTNKKYRTITITLYNSFFAGSEDVHVLVHELIHTHIEDMARFTRSILENTKGDSFAYGLLMEQFKEDQEFFVEGMANILVKLMQGR